MMQLKYRPTRRGRRLCRALGLALAIGVIVAVAGAAHAQPAPITPQQGQPAGSLLSAAQLETLMTPLAGVPQQMLPAVLDACRYPADIMDAQQTLARPGAEIKTTWNTGVQFLARYSPDLLGVLARDIGSTAALGEAYTRQPNDVLRAYGAVELRARQATQANTRAAQARPPARPPATPAAAPQNQPPPCATHGTPMHGAAGGAARGALIGEFTGDPGRRAAVGGLAGAIRRAAERRERESQQAAYANTNTCN
jgi:hypothetical protein